MLLVGYIAGNFAFFHPLLSWVKAFFVPQFFFLSCVNDYTTPMATFTSWANSEIFL